MRLQVIRDTLEPPKHCLGDKPIEKCFSWLPRSWVIRMVQHAHRHARKKRLRNAAIL
ncbi:hypothetical protein DSM3645_02848 [Blastopirellula marina DSM 3645]|uniref:Uncharacterized protein n=1 Tax=Blastopirellula marina DSM 3645 TaxID=314230 RepID=A3ZVN3_9BACT|nr:hypothetical protein DSM3645_02848 [Blastopirellula marina DSM 3645]